MTLPSLPTFSTNEYGAVNFEGKDIPCAFGGEPGSYTAYILLNGICEAIGIPVDVEIERILGNHLLAKGLGLVVFPTMGENDQVVQVKRPAISLTRLHTWLALIPPETVSDEMRAKLTATQEHFVDVVYAYFGRRLMPKEIREEDEPYLSEERKRLYKALEQASSLDARLTNVEKQMQEFSVAISAGEGGEFITADQQEQMRAMIDLLSAKYEAKHGKGTRGAMIGDIKARHNFHFFNTVRKENWPALVRDLANRFRLLTPPGTPLPRVFQIALNSVDQGALFK